MSDITLEQGKARLEDQMSKLETVLELRESLKTAEAKIGLILQRIANEYGVKIGMTMDAIEVTTIDGREEHLYSVYLTALVQS